MFYCNKSMKISLVGGDKPYPSEKYEFVSWDDDIPIYIYTYGKIKAMFQTEILQVKVAMQSVGRWPIWPRSG